MSDRLIFVSNVKILKIMANIELLAIKVKFCIQTKAQKVLRAEPMDYIIDELLKSSQKL
jgi:hypothetical protein